METNMVFVAFRKSDEQYFGAKVTTEHELRFLTCRLCGETVLDFMSEDCCPVCCNYMRHINNSDMPEIPTRHN